jgi:glucokinase
LIGEWVYGAGRGFDDLVMITLGTGLGTSAVIEGKVLRGKHGQAGCLGGHLTVRVGGHACSCGNIGCAEAEASTASLAAIAAEHPDFRDSALAREPVLDYAAVLRQAQAGDAAARALFQNSLDVWGALAVSLIHAYDPEVLILGGGIMGSAGSILPPIEKYVARHAMTPWGKVKVVPSQLGDRSALLAAEWLVGEQVR